MEIMEGEHWGHDQFTDMLKLNKNVPFNGEVC